MTTGPLYKNIGKVIRAHRRGRDDSMSQDVLAKRMGISRATLANIETGRQRIYVHQLYAIANILEIKLQDLLPKIEKDHSEVDWASLPIGGDLSIEQKNQIAKLIGK